MANDPGYPWWVASDPKHPVNAPRLAQDNTPTLESLTPEPAEVTLEQAADALRAVEPPPPANDDPPADAPQGAA